MIAPKHLLCLILFCLLSLQNLLGQSIVLGILLDAQSEEPLIGGHIELNFLNDSLQYFGVSDFDGAFEIEVEKTGEYVVKISYVSYEILKQFILVDEENNNIGTFRLKPNSVDLGEVKVTAKKLRAIQKGDTTQYNANAYATNPDAAAEDLFQKMPGFVVTDGKMQVQGEEVTRILVNGKPFFEDDPSLALKNLPADLIQNIQVFDKESEESEASGFSDGNTAKTINIVLKETFDNGTMGRIYGGYGSDNRYKAGGNLNYFKGNRRINLLGQFNNINQQNFSSADLLGISANKKNGGSAQKRSGSSRDFLIPQRKGINTTAAFGINYQDNWGEKTEVNASYFFNQSNTQSEDNLLRDYFNRTVPFSVEEETVGDSDNINHRFKARLRHKINEKNRLVFIPVLTFQQNSGETNRQSRNFLGNNLNNRLTDVFRADLGAFNFSGRLVYSHHFSKKRRNLTTVIRNQFNTSSGDRISTSTNISLTQQDTSFINQNAVLDNLRKSYSLNVRYTEPMGQRGAVQLGCTIGNEPYTSNILTSDFNGNSRDYDLPNDELSTRFSRNYQWQKGDLGYSYNRKKIKFNIRGSFQYATLSNQQVFPEINQTDKQFQNFLPSAFLRYKISKEKNLRFNFKSNTRLPRIQDLQNVVNNQNPLRLRVGNPNLNQQVNHTLTLRYAANNAEKATVFYAFLRARYIDDFIGNHLIIASETDTIDNIILKQGAQLRKPVNLSGYAECRLFLTYGLPISKLKSNFNLNFGINYRHIPSQVDNQLFFTNTQRLNAGLVWGSNISENIDFTIKSNSFIDLAQSENIENSKIYSHRLTMKVNYILKSKWRINSNFTHRYFETFDAAPIDNYILWNASLGYKCLKNNQGEIMLTMFDILNTNISITQTYNENSFTQRESLALSRYFMLSFRYNFRVFG